MAEAEFIILFFMTVFLPFLNARQNDGPSPALNRIEVRPSLQGLFEVRTSKVDFLFVLLDKSTEHFMAIPMRWNMRR
ncbi:hypothetical protein GA830_17385 [Mesorhizobium sp. NBSH29]|uniref:hypothetical protein n=1 Tax=Mesorhizobium sp. NBSH29 TaxID=2654249 RepID=UPI0018964858|nr:hypothetical protein [Mesorhizobium sp. NBSH29]QPC88332.1 hypothetical protein GA830_17385 [Mesorhizobium sp. NBSH29]